VEKVGTRRRNSSRY